VPEGTRLTATLDHALGTRSSTAGEVFTAHVSQAVSSCDADVIAKGAVMRGRVVEVQRGDRPQLAIAALDVDTMRGPAPLHVVIRSVAGRGLEEEEHPFRAFVLYGREVPPETEIEIPEGSEIVLELSEPITVVP
jgi:hypothetical protein